MEVILLEKIRNVGDIGAQVKVKSGYARNYLIPYGKAVVVNEANRVKFAKMREELEKRAAATLQLATERQAKLADATITINARATEDGKLFGSVNTSTIVQALKDMGFEVKRNEINMPQGPIHQLGEYEVFLLLHTDVAVKIKVNVVAIATE